MKVSFLGLGVMGYPMAGYLVKAGHEVCVYNRTAEKATKWVQQHGGTSASTPSEAAKGAKITVRNKGMNIKIFFCIFCISSEPDGCGDSFI